MISKKELAKKLSQETGFQITWMESCFHLWDGQNARRRIYVPAFRNLIEHWMQNEEVADWIKQTKEYPGLIFMRDHDTGRGIDRNGPMSHAWLLCEFLNTGKWPA